MGGSGGCESLLCFARIVVAYGVIAGCGRARVSWLDLSVPEEQQMCASFAGGVNACDACERGRCGDPNRQTVSIAAPSNVGAASNRAAKEDAATFGGIQKLVVDSELAYYSYIAF